MPQKKLKPAVPDPAPMLAATALPEPGPSVRDQPYSRAVAHFVAEFVLRSAENVSKVFEHDYEAAILFITISNRNSDKVMADPKLREKYGSYLVPIPAEDVLLVSRMALARSTGLPRETVRRKVAKLIAKGWIIEYEGGLRARPDLNRDQRYIATLEPQAQNLRRLFMMLLSTGVLNPASPT
jgi:hypothetical protein